MKLYELSEQFKNLEALLEREDLPQEDIIKALENVEYDINTKLEGICKFIKSIESDVIGIETEEKRLSAMKQTKKNSIVSIKEYMMLQMKGLNIANVKTPLFTVRIQNNPPSVNVIDEELISYGYKIPQPAILDKKFILQALKQGIEVPGAELKISESLRIK